MKWEERVKIKPRLELLPLVVNQGLASLKMTSENLARVALEKNTHMTKGIGKSFH